MYEILLLQNLKKKYKIVSNAHQEFLYQSNFEEKVKKFES